MNTTFAVATCVAYRDGRNTLNNRTLVNIQANSIKFRKKRNPCVVVDLLERFMPTLKIYEWVCLWLRTDERWKENERKKKTHTTMSKDDTDTLSLMKILFLGGSENKFNGNTRSRVKLAVENWLTSFDTCSTGFIFVRSPGFFLLLPLVFNVGSAVALLHSFTH